MINRDEPKCKLAAPIIFRISRTIFFVALISISLSVGVSLESSALYRRFATPIADRWQIARSNEVISCGLYRCKLEIDLGHRTHALASIRKLFADALSRKVSPTDLQSISTTLANSFASARGHTMRNGMVNSITFMDTNAVPEEAYIECEKFYRELAVKLAAGQTVNQYVPSPNFLSNIVATLTPSKDTSEVVLKLECLPKVGQLRAGHALLDRARFCASTRNFDGTIANIESGLANLRREHVSRIEMTEAYLTASKTVESINDVPPDNDLRWRRLSRFYADRAWEIAEALPVMPLKIEALKQYISSHEQFLELGEPTYDLRLREELELMKQEKTSQSFIDRYSKQTEMGGKIAAGSGPKVPDSVCFHDIINVPIGVTQKSDILRLISDAKTACKKHKWSEFKTIAERIIVSIDVAALVDVERSECYSAIGQVFYDHWFSTKDTAMDASSLDMYTGDLATMCFERVLRNCSDENSRFQTIQKLAQLTDSAEYKKQLAELTKRNLLKNKPVTSKSAKP